MKAHRFALTIMLLAGATVARTQDTVVTKVKWTRNLPPLVQAAWKNGKYASWHIFGIHRLITRADTLYTIHVALYQALGPDDADIAEEIVLYFSTAGKLLKERQL